MQTYPGRLYHNTPGWVPEGSAFHIRLRVAPAQSSLTDDVLARELLIAAKRYHGLGHWWCELFLLMPDHAHAILCFPAGSAMSEVVRQWKRATARFQKVQWQEGYFDHRLRSDAEFQYKWSYIRRNPVVKALAKSEAEWAWWWSGAVENPALETALARGGAA